MVLHQQNITLNKMKNILEQQIKDILIDCGFECENNNYGKAIDELNKFILSNNTEELVKKVYEDEIERLEEMKEQYCTSGCGCKYPYGDGSHEFSCVWKEDTFSPYNKALQDQISHYEELIKTLIK